MENWLKEKIIETFQANPLSTMMEISILDLTEYTVTLTMQINKEIQSSRKQKFSTDDSVYW